MEERDNGLDIELSSEIAEGQYANFAIITHSSAEFVADFVLLMPGLNKGKVKSRIIMTPEHAKRLLNALQVNVARYENAYGPIAVHEPESPMPIGGFGGPIAQA